MCVLNSDHFCREQKVPLRSWGWVGLVWALSYHPPWPEVAEPRWEATVPHTRSTSAVATSWRLRSCLLCVVPSVACSLTKLRWLWLHGTIPRRESVCERGSRGRKWRRKRKGRKKGRVWWAKEELWRSPKSKLAVCRETQWGGASAWLGRGEKKKREGEGDVSGLGKKVARKWAVKFFFSYFFMGLKKPFNPSLKGWKIHFMPIFLTRFHILPSLTKFRPWNLGKWY